VKALLPNVGEPNLQLREAQYAKSYGLIEVTEKGMTIAMRVEQEMVLTEVGMVI